LATNKSRFEFGVFPADEPIVNRHIATIEQLEEKIANQCVALGRIKNFKR
jgi:hypothetical protein